MVGKKRFTTALAATLLALGVTLGAPAVAASAASQPTFTGYDTSAAISEEGSDATASTYADLQAQVLDQKQVAVVSYDGGSTAGKVYIQVKQGDEVIADRLEYDLAAADGEVGLITLDFSNYQLDLHKTYSVAIYDSYDETNALYTGTFTGVWANFGGSTQLIGVHAAPASEEVGGAAYEQMKNLIVPSTYTMSDADSGSNFVYENPTVDPDDPFTFNYSLKVDSSTETTRKGTIKFVSDDGTTVATQTEELTLGEDGATATKTVDVSPIVYDADGNAWFVVNFTGKVQMSYPGRSEYTFSVRKASASTSGGSTDGKDYSVAIRYVDQDGNVLATDKVSVAAGKDYIYTPAAGLTLGTGDQAQEYELDAKATAAKTTAFDESRSAVVIDSADVANGTIDIVYTLQDSSVEQGYTVHLIKCATKTGETATEIASVPKTTKPGEDATFDLADYVKEKYGSSDLSITLDGTKYVPVNGTEQTHTFTYGSGDDRDYYVYYVPDGYKPEESYDITIQYVNIADRSVIKSEPQTIEPPTSANRLGDVSIPTPATFVGSDGHAYVRLDGQEAPIQHGYYTSYRTYTVYYRDINDNLNAGTVITRIHTRFIPGTTTTVDEGTTDQGTTTNGANGTGANGNAIGVTDNGDLVVANGANGGDNADILNSEGQDANTVRINDNQTPLAGPTATGVVAAMQQNPALIVGIVAAAAAAAILLILAMKRRRKHDDEADVPTNGEGR